MKKDKGISEFIRKHGDVLADDAKAEIARLVIEADKHHIPSKWLGNTFYRLRRTAGKGRKKKATPQLPAVEPVAPVATPVSPLEELNRAIEMVHRVVGLILTDQAQLRENFVKLQEENTRLARELDMSQATLRQRTIHELEELAMRLPEHPSVLRAVQDAKARIAVKEEGVPETLPRESRVEKLPIKYRESFLVEYRKLPKGERRQLAKALRNLADAGPQYPSLESKKLHHSLPGTPSGSWWCRASQKIRFTWLRQMQGGASVAIEVCDISHRGDSRLGYSEA